MLDVVIKLKDTMNYSLLHNDENLFEKFSFTKLKDGMVRDWASS